MSSTTQTLNYMELEGLGSEIRQGIDAHEYVDRERGGWENDR